VIAVVVAVVAFYTAGAVLNALGYTFATATAQGAVGALALSGAAAGAVAGFTGTLLHGGSVPDAIRTGLIGGLFGAIGGVVANGIGTAFSNNAFARAFTHGVSRAIMAKAQGGRWSSSFWSGFAGSVFGGMTNGIKSPNLRLAMTAIAGGTVSSISGGKFANGAVSGAFVMMFNDMAHTWTYPSKDELIHVKDYIDLNKETLLAGAQDGHLTLDEANAWYRYGNGQTLTVDGNQSRVKGSDVEYPLLIC